MELSTLLKQTPFWQAVAAFALWNFFAFLKNWYADSGKEFLRDWLVFRLHSMKGKLDKELAILLLEGAFARVELEISFEIVKVFDINDRHSEHRRAQIPAELRRAAAKGLSMVLPVLFRYRFQQMPLAKPFVDIKADFEAKELFWAPIIEVICLRNTKQDRTEAINILAQQTQILLENAKKQLKNGNQDKK